MRMKTTFICDNKKCKKKRWVQNVDPERYIYWYNEDGSLQCPSCKKATLHMEFSEKDTEIVRQMLMEQERQDNLSGFMD